MQFNFRALDEAGAMHAGQVVADDESAALRQLTQRGLTPIEIGGGAPAKAPDLLRARRVTTADRLALVQELATLLGAGISLAEALPSLASAYAALPLGVPLSRVDREVRAGHRLSAAMRTGGLELPTYVLALVEAGEASGELARALTDGATQMEHDLRIGQELRNALIYPMVLVLTGVAAVMVIFIGVVPRFASLLRSARADVPALSRWIIEAGLFFKEHLVVFGLGATALGIGVAYVLASPVWRNEALQVAARVPIVGAWLMRVDLGRWATVLGTLLANRVPIVDALTLSSGALRLARLKSDLSTTARELQRGRSLADVLATQGWFPATRLNLIRVGERSGELPRMLALLGGIETEASRQLQRRVLALIEPAAILLIGAAIGIIMIAVMMAITSLNTAVQ